MTLRVLYSGQAIRQEVRRIFKNTKQRRVAIVAFIGKGAIAHLPKPKGLEVYCWPRAGCTIASAIEQLQERHAIVHFADRMHSKVYWSERSGAIVGSANVSDNAFGSGNLHETAVAISSHQLDIDALIEQIDAELVTPDMLAALREAEVIEKRKRRAASGKVVIPTFAQWFDARGGQKWKWDFTFPSVEVFPGAQRPQRRRSIRRTFRSTSSTADAAASWRPIGSFEYA